METTSTLSQELLRAVTAEPEIAEKVQALVGTVEGMIQSGKDAGGGICQAETACRGQTGDAVRGRHAEQSAGSGDWEELNVIYNSSSPYYEPGVNVCKVISTYTKESPINDPGNIIDVMFYDGNFIYIRAMRDE